MPPKIPKIKRNPWKIAQDVQRKLAANPGAPTPVWIKAMASVPLGPKPYASLAKPNNSIQFESEKSPVLQTIMNKQKQDLMRLSRSKKSGKGPSHFVTKPPMIEYEEDEIRKTFYSQHPFELDRPRSLVFEDSSDVEWTSILGSRTKAVPLTGESVVQRTMYLHLSAPEGERISNINIAYKLALSEFYQARKDEESKEKAARSLAYQTALQLRKEQEAARLAELNPIKQQHNQQANRSAHIVKHAAPVSTEYFFGRPNAKQFMETERQEVRAGVQYRKELIEIAKSTSGSSSVKQ